MKLTMDFITHLFEYNPDTGKLFWKNPLSRRVKKGEEAGCLNRYGHRSVGIAGSFKYAHHIVWFLETGVWPKAIDHIDHQRDNNVFSNLREATQQENLKNLSKRTTNTSGVTGVYWYKPYNKWKVQISHNGKSVFGGYFDDKEEASKHRKLLEVELGFHENHGI